MTLNTRVLVALACCAAVSAAGIAYLKLVAWVEAQIAETAKARWD